MKNKYSKLREMWAVPKYKLLIKLGMWFVFFLFIYILAGITSLMNNNKTIVDNSDTKINFTKMKNNLENSNLKIKYTIGDYFIEGTISDNILTGTLEYQDVVYKIKYDGINIYQIKKDEETQTDLLNDINKSYFLPKNIINNISNDNNVTKSSDNKIYSYFINDIAYSFYLNDTAIQKIIILDNKITYEFNYNILS